jgi:hypothetical protein
MIAPSGVYRIPRADASSRDSKAARYARLEYGSGSLTWMTFTAPASPGLWARLTLRLASIFGRARPSYSSARPAPLRTGVAAVRFAGDLPQSHPAVGRPESHLLWEGASPHVLVLPVLEADEKAESCECQP